MEKIVGKVTSNASGKEYSVKWNTTTKEVWIQTREKDNCWEMACENISTRDAALECAKTHINRFDKVK